MFNVTVVDIERRPVVLETLAPLSEHAKVTLVDPEDKEALCKLLSESDALVVRLYPTGRDLLAMAPRLKVVIKVGVGVDNIDVAAATEMGIHVAVSPGNHISVAETAILLMLAVSRNLIYLNKNVHPDAAKAGKELCDKHLGLVGFGRIGSHVAQIARGFGMHVKVFDPYISDAAKKEIPCTFTTFEDVITTSDFISLHCPSTPDTFHLIGEKEFAAMKNDAVIVNTARGAVIDEAALVMALRNAVIGGAGLDVVENEPLTAENPLLALDNVIVTPHKLIQTVDSFRRQTGSIVEAAIEFSRGTVSPLSINKDKIDPKKDRMKR